MENKKPPENMDIAEAKARQEFLGLTKEYQVLLFSAIGGIAIVFVGIIFGGQKLYGLFFGVGIVIAFVPYSLVSFFAKKKIYDMEENLPAFLREVVESKKAGMTIPQAIYKTAKTDYGALTPELQRMANQLSWGIPFNDVLRRFAKRTKSRFIERSIAIIIEAQISGGELTNTLDSVAKDARLIKESEKERKAKLNQQALIMYALFFMFVAIVIALQKLMLPMVTSKGFALSAESPEAILSYYRDLFFSMIVIQAIFNGLLAGEISEGSVVMGLKHSVIFLVAGVILSWLFIF